MRPLFKEGILKIGEKELECAVLEDGTRVISRNAIFRAFGRTKRGRAKYETRVPNMPTFIDAKNLQPYINNDLEGELKQIKYINISKKETTGYKATVIPLLCDLYLEARDKGVLTKSQLPLAMASEILLRSFAKVGIIALVDEATGFQYERDQDSGIYKSTKSKQKATMVKGEPAPPTPDKGEKWVQIVDTNPKN